MFRTSLTCQGEFYSSVGVRLQSMQVTTIENVILAFVLFTMTVAGQIRARRRFCETYPFARRCLGVAAKRDVTSLHTENSREQRLLEIENMLENERFTERTESPETLFPTTYVKRSPVSLLEQILNNRRRFGLKRQDEFSISLKGISEDDSDFPDGFWFLLFDWLMSSASCFWRNLYLCHVLKHHNMLETNQCIYLLLLGI